MKTKQAVNPYMPSWEYVPDAEPHVVGDRVYVYGSHDIFNGLNFCLGDYVCWSAPVDDLGNWRYEGCIYKREQGSGSTENPSDKWALQRRIWCRDRMEDFICTISWVVQR